MYNDLLYYFSEQVVFHFFNNYSHTIVKNNAVFFKINIFIHTTRNPFALIIMIICMITDYIIQGDFSQIRHNT